MTLHLCSMNHLTTEFLSRKCTRLVETICPVYGWVINWYPCMSLSLCTNYPTCTPDISQANTVPQQESQGLAHTDCCSLELHTLLLCCLCISLQSLIYPVYPSWTHSMRKSALDCYCTLTGECQVFSDEKNLLWKPCFYENPDVTIEQFNELCHMLK